MAQDEVEVVQEIEVVQKGIAYVWGQWTIMKGPKSLKLRNEKVVISLSNEPSMFWLSMDDDTIDKYGNIVYKGSSAQILITDFILENQIQLHKPTFTTDLHYDTTKFTLASNGWVMRYQGNDELEVTNRDECYIFVKKFSSDVHSIMYHTTGPIRRSYFVQN